MNRNEMILRAANQEVLDQVRAAVANNLCCDVDQRYRVFVLKDPAPAPLEIRINATEDGVEMLRAISGVELTRCL